MDLTPYVSSLREDLLAAAAAGDEQTQRTASLLVGAIEPAARLAMLHALSDMAAEVTESLGDGRTVEFSTLNTRFDVAFPVQHLGEHLALAQPITVTFKVEDGRNEVVKLADAEQSP